MHATYNNFFNTQVELVFTSQSIGCCEIEKLTSQYQCLTPFFVAAQQFFSDLVWSQTYSVQRVTLTNFVAHLIYDRTEHNINNTPPEGNRQFMNILFIIKYSHDFHKKSLCI